MLARLVGPPARPAVQPSQFRPGVLPAPRGRTAERSATDRLLDAARDAVCFREPALVEMLLEFLKRALQTGLVELWLARLRHARDWLLDGGRFRLSLECCPALFERSANGNCFGFGQRRPCLERALWGRAIEKPLAPRRPLELQGKQGEARFDLLQCARQLASGRKFCQPAAPLAVSARSRVPACHARAVARWPLAPAIRASRGHREAVAQFDLGLRFLQHARLRLREEIDALGEFFVAFSQCGDLLFQLQQARHGHRSRLEQRAQRKGQFRRTARALAAMPVCTQNFRAMPIDVLVLVPVRIGEPFEHHKIRDASRCGKTDFGETAVHRRLGERRIALQPAGPLRRRRLVVGVAHRLDPHAWRVLGQRRLPPCGAGAAKFAFALGAFLAICGSGNRLPEPVPILRRKYGRRRWSRSCGSGDAIAPFATGFADYVAQPTHRWFTPAFATSTSRLHRERTALHKSALLPERRHAVADPFYGEFFGERVLLEAFVQRREIHAVERLVLVEAGKYPAGFSAHRIAVRLQALRADLLHHALHRRVDRTDRPGFRCGANVVPARHRRHHRSRRSIRRSASSRRSSGVPSLPLA